MVLQEMEREFAKKYIKMHHIKQESAERYNNRKLERHINQFQASQNLDNEKIELIQLLSDEDPQLFEELGSKKKWSYTVKNP